MSKTATQAYIFDYGATLDTGGKHWGRVLWDAWKQAGVPVSEAQFREAYVFTERLLGSTHVIRPDFTFRQMLSEKLRIELEHVGCLSYHQTILEQVYEQTLGHTAHSREVLSRLPQQKVLVSNFYGNMPTVLREFGLDGLFQEVVESAVVGIRKPDPRIFSLGVKALGLPADQVTVVCDSIEKDIRPAKLLGCHTVWLRGQQWEDKAVEESLPDRIITDLEELL